MSAYVMLTAFLFQRGSAESLDPDDPHRHGDTPPARLRGRIRRWLYSYGLGLSLAGLFVLSFTIHWLASAAAANEEAARHGGEIKSVLSYLFDPPLWFESFQNWQSDFLKGDGGRAVHLPAIQGLARIDACLRPTRPDGSLNCRAGPIGARLRRSGWMKTT